MKAVIVCCLALALAVHAASPVSYIGQIGYNTHTEVDKSGGISSTAITVSPSDWPSNGTSLKLYLRVITAATVLDAGGAAVDFWFTEGAVADTSTTPAVGNTKAASAAYPKFHFQIMNPATTTVYFTSRANSCGTCSSTVEMLAGFYFVWLDPAVTDTTKQLTTRANAFQTRDNSYVTSQAIMANNWGASGIVTVVGFNTYVKVDGATLDTQTVVVSTKLPGLTDTPATYPISATWYVLPSVAGTTGNINSNAVVTADGKWYVTPYVVKIQNPTSSYTTLDYAVGYGHEPSAASTAAPSVVILALVAAALLKAL